MQHRLNITFGTKPVREVQAETNLGASPQLATPETITGKLLSLSVEDLFGLKFDCDVSVGFEGHAYHFESLEKDGSFMLRRTDSA
jgi:hypothetical protein